MASLRSFWNAVTKIYGFEERLFDNLNARYQKIINNQEEMVAPACGCGCTNTGMGC